jgi:cyclic AMP-dependent transcription factor ATF-4
MMYFQQYLPYPEPYSNNNWYVEKAEVPEIYDGYIPMADWNVSGQVEAKFQPPVYQQPPQTQIEVQPAPPPPPSNHFLLQELEDALTPPDSPKDDQLELVKSLLQDMGPVEANRIEVPVGGFDTWGVEATAESVCSASSPEPWSSPQGGSSESSSGEDADWTPYRTSTDRPSAPRQSRPKPYSRPAPSVEEKKLRKKEQNKNAASRYRQKKKAEIEEILTEEKALADHNEKLKADVVELGREIKYLKSLMREFFKKKGLLK